MPVLICLLVEKGLAVEIIQESLGMFIHVTNIIVLILIPMVIIHVRGQVFSLSEDSSYSFNLESITKGFFLFIPSQLAP